MPQQVAVVQRAQAEVVEVAVQGDIQRIVELACVGLHESQQAVVGQADLMPALHRLRECVDLLPRHLLGDHAGQQARRELAVFGFFAGQQRGGADRELVELGGGRAVVQAGDRAGGDAHRLHRVQAFGGAGHRAHDLVEIHRFTGAVALGHAHGGRGRRRGQVEGRRHRRLGKQGLGHRVTPCLDRQADAALLVDFQHLDLDDVAFLELVGDLLDALVGDLRDVHQAVLARGDGDERAEVHQLGDLAFVDAARLDVGGDLLDARLAAWPAAALTEAMTMVPSSWMSIWVPVSLVIAWITAALADHFADLVRVDLDGQQARRVLAQLGTRRGQRLGHLAEDVQAAGLAWASATFMISSVMPSILMSICSAVMPFGGAGHLEVHVAEVILVAEDVGQHGEVVAFLDQAHRDAGDRRLDRHAGVHQRQRGTADRGHRGRAVRLGDLGDDADGVGEVFHRRHHGQHAALGEAAVADFAALRAHHAAGFTHRVGREVVVEQEVILVLAFDRVDDLRVARGAERGHHQRLRLAAGEQRRAVGARQHADLRTRSGARSRASRPSMRTLVTSTERAWCGIRVRRIPSTARRRVQPLASHGGLPAMPSRPSSAPRWRRDAPACRAPGRPARRSPMARLERVDQAVLGGRRCQFHFGFAGFGESSLIA
jgi:hypothetical protein